LGTVPSNKPPVGRIARSLAAHDDTERKGLHVVVCQTAADGMQGFAKNHGVTNLTALLDALGHALGALKDMSEAELGAMAPVVAQLAEAARRYDFERRYRR
jgi:hypothetical protein